jgi:hypothetical protein
MFNIVILNEKLLNSKRTKMSISVENNTINDNQTSQESVAIEGYINEVLSRDGMNVSSDIDIYTSEYQANFREKLKKSRQANSIVNLSSLASNTPIIKKSSSINTVNSIINVKPQIIKMQTTTAPVLAQPMITNKPPVIYLSNTPIKSSNKIVKLSPLSSSAPINNNNNKISHGLNEIKCESNSQQDSSQQHQQQQQTQTPQVLNLVLVTDSVNGSYLSLIPQN